MTNSQKVRDLYPSIEEFETLLSDADDNIQTDWEINFVEDMFDRYKKYGREMYLSESQKEQLERIAEK